MAWPEPPPTAARPRHTRPRRERRPNSRGARRRARGRRIAGRGRRIAGRGNAPRTRDIDRPRRMRLGRAGSRRTREMIFGRGIRTAGGAPRPRRPRPARPVARACPSGGPGRLGGLGLEGAPLVGDAAGFGVGRSAAADAARARWRAGDVFGSGSRRPAVAGSPAARNGAAVACGRHADHALEGGRWSPHVWRPGSPPACRRTLRRRRQAWTPRVRSLARWEADGVITPAVVAAIRIALPPLTPGINIAVVVAIVGGLLIAAAFLAFVAARIRIEIARLSRLAMLFAGILGSPWPRRMVRSRRPAGTRRSLRRHGRDHLWRRDRAGWPDVPFGWRLCRRHAAVVDRRAGGSGIDRLARGACRGTRCRKHLELDARL